MKRPTQMLMFTTMLVGVALVVATVVPSAHARKNLGIEAGDIAFVDVFTLVDRALVAEDMAKARKDFSDESTKSLDGLQKQMQDVQNQLSTMQQNDPNAGTIYGQYQNLQQQIQLTSQQINEDYQSLIANQIAQAYTEIYAAANDIAAEQGYSFVFATRSDGKLVQTDTITGITQEILARPLVTPPSGVDLTEQVRLKLGYPDESASVYDENSTDEQAVTEPGDQGDAADAGDEPKNEDPMDDENSDD